MLWDFIFGVELMDLYEIWQVEEDLLVLQNCMYILITRK
jgi:hypothetical protein